MEGVTEACRKTRDHPRKTKLGTDFTAKGQRSSSFSPSSTIRTLYSNKLLTGCPDVRQIKTELFRRPGAWLPPSCSGRGPCLACGREGVGVGERKRKLYLLSISFLLDIHWLGSSRELFMIMMILGRELESVIFLFQDVKNYCQPNCSKSI